MVWLRGFVAVVGLIWGAGAATAATLNVVGGQLVGAFDVEVAGTLYDVEFVEGTCIALFSGCDEISDTPFASVASGSTLAAQALLDQVFVDGIAGTFDTDPELTAGCEATNSCIVLIPHQPSGGTGYLAVEARNVYPGGLGGDTTGSSSYIITDDTTLDAYRVFALWTEVPEPRLTGLLAAGLAPLLARGNGRRLAQRRRPEGVRER
jgi:hypothetical protein